MSDRVDWAHLIAHLRESGVSVYAIARYIGVDDKTVRGWIGGSEPRYCSGEALLHLYQHHTGEFPLTSGVSTS